MRNKWNKRKTYDPAQDSEFDKALIQVITTIILHPDFRPLGCCSGHFEWCCLDIEVSKDDSYLSDSLEYDTMYCNGTSQPFLTFEYNAKSVAANDFADFLRTKCQENRWTWYEIDKKNDVVTVTFAYGNGDEDYEPLTWKEELTGPKQQFRQFWQTFCTGWNQFIVGKTDETTTQQNVSLMEPLTSFPIKQRCECGKLKKQSRKSETKHDYLSTELFSDFYWEQLADFQTKKTKLEVDVEGEQLG